MRRAMSVRRWVRTPKGLLTIVLVILVAIAAPLLTPYDPTAQSLGSTEDKPLRAAIARSLELYAQIVETI